MILNPLKAELAIMLLASHLGLSLLLEQLDSMSS
jgi:hypothetical protein